MLQDILCRGLGDPDIRLDLLSDKNQDMTLEQVFKFVDAKEARKRSATHLLVPQHTDALSKSTYLSGKGSQSRRAIHLTTGSKQSGPGMKLVHTVEEVGMDAMRQRGCDGRSARCMASNANSAVMTITLSRYAGANPPPGARSMRMPFSTRCALSPHIVGRRVPSWTTICTTN